jgi:hypothetical protein
MEMMMLEKVKKENKLRYNEQIKEMEMINDKINLSENESRKLKIKI